MRHVQVTRSLGLIGQVFKSYLLLKTIVCLLFASLMSVPRATKPPKCSQQPIKLREMSRTASGS